ncbi:dioxygenase family protein [Rhodococcus opacus]|uniref:Catechol 1,2-dioxygenase n=1 Tax=Rhodococcus opacus TaxID=37919 RepID=A0A076F5B8_RHOOP|nr:dioxygenase [Rhodococcus opacus]AII10864.1 catechol 1,2-dioxygenase [Rhodococcus opacus]
MSAGIEVSPTALASGNAATERFRERGVRRGDPPTSPRRISEIVNEVLHGIHDAIRRHKVTYTEYQAVKDWLISVGENGEWPLFMDVFLEHVVEEVAHEHRQGSQGTIEGPYYLPGQKTLPSHSALPMREDERGTRFVFTGQVLGLEGEPVPFARLDLWHADNDGYYSGFAPGIPEGNLRGVIVTDEHGKFAITTILPAPYQIPTDGAVGALIRSAEWSPWRPAHLHLIVSKLGYFPLTTQLYFRDGQWLDNDIAQATKPELILDVAPNPVGVLETHYDFTLDPVQP